MSWLTLFLCAVGTGLIIAWPWLRHVELDVLIEPYGVCKSLYDTNAALLKSAFCDQSANELAFKNKVGCAKARKENAWGARWSVMGCTVASLLTVNVITDAIQYALHSWSVYVFLLIMAAVSLKYYLMGRAEVAKHRAAIKAQERAMDKFMSGGIGPPIHMLENKWQQRQRYQQEYARPQQQRTGYYQIHHK